MIKDKLWGWFYKRIMTYQLFKYMRAHKYSDYICSKTDGTLWSCGTNQYGELGQSNKTQYNSI